MKPYNLDALPDLPEINVTPLVDVMLVLVVFLLLLAPMIGHSLPVNIPKVATAGTTLAALPKIVVLPDGQFKVDGVLTSEKAAVNYAVVKGGAVLYADQTMPYARVAQAMSAFASAGVPISLAVDESGH